MVIKVQKLTETAKVPYKGSAAAAGVDLYADILKEEFVYPGSRIAIPTGIAVEIPAGYAGFIFARSGKACKEGVRPSNCVGVIDSDYRGMVIVNVTCDDIDPKRISPNERIAQLVILPVPEVEYQVVDYLEDSERGDGGFGHSGKF